MISRSLAPPRSPAAEPPPEVGPDAPTAPSCARFALAFLARPEPSAPWTATPDALGSGRARLSLIHI